MLPASTVAELKSCSIPVYAAEQRAEAEITCSSVVYLHFCKSSNLTVYLNNVLRRVHANKGCQVDIKQD